MKRAGEIMVKKIGIALILIFCGFVVFVFGNPYYRVFPTNWNQAYYIGITLFFLACALFFKRSAALARYWQAAYAFFAASAALVFLRTGLLDIPRSHLDGIANLAADKAAQFLHIVPVILVLTIAARWPRTDLFIQQGKLKQGLLFGLGTFSAFAVIAFILYQGTPLGKPEAVPAILVFIFANSIMEELWFRALFLKKFAALVGRNLAILSTAVVFGASHYNATYSFPGGLVVFALVVFGLGVIGAYSMYNDDSLLPPVLFHAGYDLMVLLSVLESL
jgi:membrane protease YdiL (CAAX protease family)